jgi:quercetin dioxygenase-like cupin family protein
VEFSGEWIAIGNDSVSDARVIATALLPLQAPLAVTQEGFMSDPYVHIQSNSRGVDTRTKPSGPALVERAAARVESPDGAFAVLQWKIHLEPGEWTPRSAQDGHEFDVVTSGVVTVLRGDTVEVFSPGQMWINISNVNHSEGNKAEVPVEVVISELVPR